MGPEIPYPQKEHGTREPPRLPERTWDQGPARHLVLLLLALNINMIQWRILEFPEGREPTQRWGRNILFWQFFPDNCMKLKKKNWTKKGIRPFSSASPPPPPRFTNVIWHRFVDFFKSCDTWMQTVSKEARIPSAGQMHGQSIHNVHRQMDNSIVYWTQNNQRKMYKHATVRFLCCLMDRHKRQEVDWFTWWFFQAMFHLWLLYPLVLLTATFLLRSQNSFTLIQKNRDRDIFVFVLWK